MEPSPRKSGTQAYPYELSFEPLKSCLVNLPASLSTALVNANKIAQNVVVEILYRSAAPSSTIGKKDGKLVQKSVYVGWTGLQSKRKLVPLIGRDGLSQPNGKEQDISLLEIDSVFGKMSGLSDGLKVEVVLHLDPAEVHTINIEPLTPTDWEIIELHANFLELNLLAQIRALPNPNFKSAGGSAPHLLTLHLSPTSTANILVTSLTPTPAASSPFVKVSPNSEVHVAPRTRAKTSAISERDSHSTDDKSTTSTTKTKSRRSEGPVRNSIFLRGVNRELAEEWFDEEDIIDKDEGLKIWVDWSVMNSKDLRSVSWVLVSIVHPAGFRAAEPVKPQQAEGQENIKPTASVIAQLCPWEDAPNPHHVALSSLLYLTLDCPQLVGEMIRIEAAPSQLHKADVKILKVHPLPILTESHKQGFHFGGKTKTNREESARKLLSMFGGAKGGNHLFEGPLTDGMILPALDDLWAGGIIKFNPPSGAPIDRANSTRGWLLGSERRLGIKSSADTQSQSSSLKLLIEVVGETVRPDEAFSTWSAGDTAIFEPCKMVGIDPLIAQLTSHIRHGSSILLTGGRGSGRTTLSQLLAHNFQRDFYHTTYLSCHKLIAAETRVSAIKDALNRLFGLASWGARNGGHALIILDDLDSICPVETELQVGDDNGRSRHISEILISLVRRYCSMGSQTTLLAVAKSKEEINNAVVGGHVVREIVNLSAPDKETRRTILESFVKAPQLKSQHEDGNGSGIQKTENEWECPNPTTADIPSVNASIDFLDLAGQTDGYMPGDLKVLVARARSEALLRVMFSGSSTPEALRLVTVDFTAALKGFTPTSLRNVTLQHSTTTFSSIGGLRETRQVLLETLQYPTLYAPIFARCPLRLRSGLLLYGYPGCGKTLLASAVAGECGLNFISVKGPEILNKYIGASEKSVRDLFDRAQAARPCVLFFDEFDSVAPKRGHDSTGVTDRVVNQLLTQMDGAEGLSGVYVLAATSRPDLIDPALLRPGRLDKSLLCDMPDYEDRVDILQALSKQLKVDPQLFDSGVDSTAKNMEEVARRTEGYSGADLQAVIYNAHLEAIHDVLGDRTDSVKSTKDKPATGIESANVLATDFTYFRLSQAAEEAEPQLSAAGKASERAKIAAQLAVHRAAQRKIKQTARQNFGRRDSDGGDDKAERVAGNQEPVIEWQHIERSLAQTRPSVSGEERRRLKSIYREFLVGRNGEMPDGQGGNKVGGRTSLM